MKKRLTYISPLQLGIVQAVTMGIISLIMVPFLLLGALFHGGLGVGLMAIVFPVIYAVAGFIGGIISAVVYNAVAKWTGGIEYIAAEAPQTAS
ncbi:MAG TPA: hypothetical protein VMF08_07325 [Candidatus Sulfotelmatobacter sp.]|nr:hypothetical protein [Candidatus Sulfotelmatobacter sp.]